MAAKVDLGDFEEYGTSDTSTKVENTVITKLEVIDVSDCKEIPENKRGSAIILAELKAINQKCNILGFNIKPIKGDIFNLLITTNKIQINEKNLQFKLELSKTSYPC